MLTVEIYISPENEVLATTEVRPLFQSGIRRYPLQQGKWYKLAKECDIPPAPNSDDFIWVCQYEDDELFKAIPHKPEHFLTIQQWRENRLKDILVD